MTLDKLEGVGPMKKTMDSKRSMQEGANYEKKKKKKKVDEETKRLRGCLVYNFKQQFSVFKHTYQTGP